MYNWSLLILMTIYFNLNPRDTKRSSRYITTHVIPRDLLGTLQPTWYQEIFSVHYNQRDTKRSSRYITTHVIPRDLLSTLISKYAKIYHITLKKSHDFVVYCQVVICMETTKYAWFDPRVMKGDVYRGQISYWLSIMMNS